MYNFRTDMADERRDIYQKANNLNSILGIETEEKIIDNNIKTNIVKITDAQGEQAIGKPIGTYVTIDIKNLKLATDDDINKASEVVKDELQKIINTHCNSTDEILVVGLGNQFVTPDSLGPKVVSEIDVTKHFIKYTPQYVAEGTRSVCAIAPGVLGTTGIETSEIIKGIVDNVKPKMLIVIDSLASKSIERISSTVQISDTGIVPGGGVGNAREELSENTIGIPVIAIGVPMVVESAVLVNDCLDLFIGKLQNEAKSNNYLNDLKEHDNYEEIKESLNPSGYNMIVTPKEIDDLIENMKDVVAKAINFAV
ncbi:MAG: GPR endopeptidase [Clostridia bacterium]|nr:GPR endopeptidase [Clostridia bacterium]